MKPSPFLVDRDPTEPPPKNPAYPPFESKGELIEALNTTSSPNGRTNIIMRLSHTDCSRWSDPSAMSK